VGLEPLDGLGMDTLLPLSVDLHLQTFLSNSYFVPSDSTDS
jgi:hypothetical protein